MNSLPPEVLSTIITYMGYTIATLFGLGFSVFAFFHKGLIRGQNRIEAKIDKIDEELQPLKTDIAVQREKHDTLQQRLNQHEERIRALETKHK